MSGCRYQRAIKQSINKMFNNKSSVNIILAELIAEYSHKITIRPGCYLFGPRREFFIIKNVISQHWVTGFFCPPRVEFVVDVVLYHPDLRRKTRIQKKRLFDPFKNAMVRSRSKQFHLHKKQTGFEFLDVL